MKLHFLGRAFYFITKKEGYLKKAAIFLLIVLSIYAVLSNFTSINRWDFANAPPGSRGMEQSAPNTTMDAFETNVTYVSDAWVKYFELKASSPNHAINTSNFPSWLPLPPHLQDCVIVTAQREELERIDPHLGYPKWVVEKGRVGVTPPWVKGSDENNLPLTRWAQRDLWINQHPLDCKSEETKLMVVAWFKSKGYGIGAQLHTMAAFLAIAVSLGRTLVPHPRTFQRSQSKHCKGRYYGSLECYFFRMASSECTNEALRLMKLRNFIFHSERSILELQNCKKKLVVVKTNTWRMYALLHELPIGYMLRWPSQRLCHLANIARHQVFGDTIIREQLLAKARQRDDVIPMEWEKLSHVIPTYESLHVSYSESNPSLPRPILSLHIRQGDKHKEMDLFSFKSHMYFAEKIRSRAPHLHTIWLSTEMQNVVDESKEYPSWTFFYTNTPRQVGNKEYFKHEQASGKTALVDASFVNLLIASECDFFVGTLGSNWNRLINELRLTNGRVGSGYVSLNPCDTKSLC